MWAPPRRWLPWPAASWEEEVKLRVEEFGALFAANLMDEGVDLAGIVDAVVGRGDKEKGPTVGEYFLYAVLNRMVEARPKRALPEWYGRTAVQQIRPVDISVLSSRRYWEAWERVEEGELKTYQRFRELTSRRVSLEIELARLRRSGGSKKG